MSFDLFFQAGGYWGRDGEYLGGQVDAYGSHIAEDFKFGKVLMLLQDILGYEDNMNKISWFPFGSSKREDIEDDEKLFSAVHYGVASGGLTLYVVRSDDPYIDMRMLGGRRLSDEDDDDTAAADDDDPEHFYSNSDSEDEGRTELDDTKYKAFVVGQEYKTIDSFKKAITKYAVKKRKNIKYKKTDSTRALAICAENKCQWRIFASINSSSTRVFVRSLHDEHNCTWHGKVSLLTNARIAEMYIEEFRENPDISAGHLQAKLLKQNVNVSWTICERTRLRCLQTFDRAQAEQLARLHDYVYELRRSNPNSTVECEVRQSKFHRFYVCFAGLQEGWREACRRILHIDGTFLKWRMTGMLLVACGRDPNDQTFPLAWGIVDVESKENWVWFFEHLVEDLGLQSGNGFTIASDQQKGLIAVVKVVLPYSEHRMCARHVHGCWKK
ncbi:hypothetical protein V5N11_034642 [Cardamine amara subsp. amara]|uniref:Transposase n=1 Tax=Cardamine amara subsp. amara TaxID=228776 RepID=A0ABD1AC90_CARAN